MGEGDDDTIPANPSTVQTLAKASTAPKRQRPRDTQGELNPGERLGDRYVVKGFLGAGGMGAVYRVFDEILGVEVALKAVRSAIAHDESLREEVRLAQRVTHPSVCRTYDLEDVGGRHFIKMELIPGESLHDRLGARGRLSVSDTIAIARAIAAGLAAAHGQGIVHRDLKPGNVMLGGGRVVLMDFGLALYVQEDAPDLAGTPGYMSPEQARGDKVDVRSDLFALGCIVYEMLAGEPAFAGRAPQTVTPDVRAKRPDTPRWLARATTLLLDFDPARRAPGLDLLVHGPRSWRLPIAIAAVAAIAGVATWWVTRPGPAWTPQILDLAPAYDENTNEAAISPDGTTLVFTSNLGSVDNTFAVYTVPILGGIPTRVAAPVDVVTAHWLRDGTGFVVSSLANRVRQHVALLRRDGSLERDLGAGTMADDCGGGRFVAIKGDVTNQLVELPGGRVLYTSNVSLNNPHCDAEGKRVLFWRGEWNVGRALGVLMLRDADGSVRELTEGLNAVQGAFTPGDRSIVYAERDANQQVNIVELDLASGAHHRITVTGGPDASPSVTPDGERLVFNRDVTYTRLFNRKGVRIPSEHQWLDDIRLSPDGHALIAQRTTHEGGSVVVFGLADASQRPLGAGRRPFPSHDGHSVYFVHDLRRNELWRVPLAGGAPERIATFPGDIIAGVDTTDGLHITTLTKAGQFDGYRVGPAGPVLERSGASIVPAPSGPWRLEMMVAESAVAAGDRRVVLDGCHDAFLWVDEHRLACDTDTEVVLVDVEAAKRTSLGALPVRPQHVALGMADGEVIWITTQLHGRVTRHVITNFGDRPWKP